MNITFGEFKRQLTDGVLDNINSHKHNLRVTELLEYNNQKVEENRKLKRQYEALQLENDLLVKYLFRVHGID